MLLFFLRVAGQIQNIHPVQKSRRNGIVGVGRGEEENIGKVKIKPQEVIPEGFVLFRIQNLQKRRRGIPFIIGAQLIDFIQQNDRVHAPGFLHGMNHPPLHRADVSTAMAADFRLVAHAAQRHPHKLAVERMRNRTGDRGFPHPGRADKAKNLTAKIRGKGVGRQIFDHPVLNLFEAIMLVIQNLPCPGDITAILGVFSIRKRQAKV